MSIQEAHSAVQAAPFIAVAEALRATLDAYFDSKVLLDQHRASLMHMVAPDPRFAFRESQLVHRMRDAEERAVTMLRAAGGTVTLDGYTVTIETARAEDRRKRSWFVIRPTEGGARHATS